MPNSVWKILFQMCTLPPAYQPDPYKEYKKNSSIQRLSLFRAEWAMFAIIVECIECMFNTAHTHKHPHTHTHTQSRQHTQTHTLTHILTHTHTGMNTICKVRSETFMVSVIVQASAHRKMCVCVCVSMCVCVWVCVCVCNVHIFTQNGI